MLSTLDKSATESFLKICKREIPKGHCHFINRNLNINGRKVSSKQALLDLGIIKIAQIWDYILKLTVEDCIKVEADYDSKRDTNSEMYIFKINIESNKVYIKLTLRENGIICLSFHQDY